MGYYKNLSIGGTVGSEQAWGERDFTSQWNGGQTMNQFHDYKIRFLNTRGACVNVIELRGVQAPTTDACNRYVVGWATKRLQYENNYGAISYRVLRWNARTGNYEDLGAN